MKHLIVFLLAFPLLFTNCGQDKCKKKDCGTSEFGDCNSDNGECDCYEGITKVNGKCTLEDREKFIKTFFTTSSFCNGGSFPQGTPLSCSRTGDQNDVEIQFGGSSAIFILKGNVIGNTISISGQYDGDEYSGNGSLSSNGNLLLLTITRRRTGSQDCVFNITGT